jgi:ssDNA-binding Zn-finger/Zn-ribbon topoisomerase 1
VTIKEVKEAPKKRQLSIKGTDNVLKKRLLERLVKEKDPEYTPKPKGRHCKWCGALMKKKNSFRGEFYGCSTWPACQERTLERRERLLLVIWAEMDGNLITRRENEVEERMR